MNVSYKIDSSGGNNVRIMTIHASKGLEFPICFFPMLYEDFNKEDSKRSFGYDKKYGIYIPFSDSGNKNTILKTLVSYDINKKDISEKVRLLYVAHMYNIYLIYILPLYPKFYNHTKLASTFLNLSLAVNSRKKTRIR